jgi:hypothetical protein
MQNAATVLDVLREIAGEPRAGKLAREVRTGSRWKRTRHQAGTSPAAYRCSAWRASVGSIRWRCEGSQQCGQFAVGAYVLAIERAAGRGRQAYRKGQ